MAVQQRVAELTCARAEQESFQRRVAMTEVKYLDLGLEYHAFPLQLRRTEGVAQADCLSAFIMREGAPAPDCIGFLNDLWELCTTSRHHLEHYQLDAAGAALSTATEILEALDEQLVAVHMCVDTLHRQFSDMMDDNVDFAEGREYRLAMLPDQGREKHALLRGWAMALPHVRVLFRSGAVRSEDEALSMVVCAVPPACLPSGIAGVRGVLPARVAHPDSDVGNDLQGENMPTVFPDDSREYSVHDSHRRTQYM